MSEPASMTDIEFLLLPELTQQHHLYLYRENSALLRSAVRAKVMRQAEMDGRGLKAISTYSRRAEKSHSRVTEPEEKEVLHVDRDGSTRADQSSQSDERPKDVLLPSLYMTVAEPSLFGSALTIRDLGDKTLKHPPLDDIEAALDLVANDAAQQSLCLLVPETHELVKSEAWRAAVRTIGLIEEPLVMPENYLVVARSYFPKSRLGDLRYLSDNRRFLSQLRKFVAEEPRTPFELSMQIDIIVLGEMESGEFREGAEVTTSRAERWVLPETLRRFLDSRDTPSLSALMRLVDRLRHDRMLEPHEVLTRLYRATAGTLESRDRRYRRSEDPCHCIWASLLLANENTFLRGNAFVALDYVCQQYARAAGAPSWFGSIEGWKACAPLVEICVHAKKSSRLDKARLELQRALRARLVAMKTSDVDWFQSLIRLTESEEAATILNEQGPLAVAEAD